jgi:diguanylate cyclase (GGDEF)-like protein/PAS domain S-box-containing protein
MSGLRHPMIRGDGDGSGDVDRGGARGLMDPAGSDRADPGPRAVPFGMAREEADFLRGVLCASPAVTVLVDRDGTVLWISDNVRDLFDFAPDELIGSNMVEHMDVEWSAFAIHSVGYAMEEPGQHMAMLFRFLRRSGEGVICEVTANNQFADPAVGGLVVQVRRAEERVLLDRVLDSMAGAEPLVDTLALLVSVAGAETLAADASILYGRSDEGFLARVSSAGLDPALAGDPATADYDLNEAAPWGRSIARGEPVMCAVADLPAGLAELAADAGYETCWSWPVGVSGGVGVQGCVVMWRREPGDPEPSCEMAAHRLVHLTALALERERSQRRLLHAALHDPLTGLANRARFFSDLDESLTAPARKLVGVLYIDLDGFKPINDAFGHGFGDQVLVEIARRMQALVRPSDVVARLGGDEFAVLCPGVRGHDEVQAIAERIVKQASRAIDIEGNLGRVAASVGIAVAPAGSCTSDSLVEAADAALYAVKAGSKGGWRLAPPLDRTG